MLLLHGFHEGIYHLSEGDVPFALLLHCLNGVDHRAVISVTKVETDHLQGILSETL